MNTANSHFVLPFPPFRFLCLAALCLCFRGAAEGTEPVAANTAMGEKSPASLQPLFETWGWSIAREQDLEGIELKPQELDVFLRGWNSSFDGGRLPYDFQKIRADLESLQAARRAKRVKATIAHNEALAKAFFSGLKKNPRVARLADNVRYEIVEPGSGPCPRPQQTVNVHYFGRQIDGTEFIEYGPLDVILVPNRSVCRGWIEAMQKLRPGGRMKLYVPPPLTKAEADARGIPPGSAMVFEIELSEVKDTPKEALDDALVPPAPPPPSDPSSGLTDSQLLELWGWFAARQAGIIDLGFDAEERGALARGLAAGIRRQPCPTDLGKTGPVVKRFQHDRREAVERAAHQKRLDDGRALFVSLQQDPDVVALPSGLRYKILRPGTGPCPRLGQVVSMLYSGHLIDGTQFEKSEGDEPSSLALTEANASWITHGWVEGVQHINGGGKIRLFVPPELGYGEEAVEHVPPGSTLIFDIELFEVADPKPDGG